MGMSGRWFAVCLLPAIACGPFTSGDGARQEEPSATPSQTPAGDAGTGPSGGGIDSTDGGNADPAGGGSAKEVLVLHDVHVEGITADVIYAHDVKAKSIRCDQLVTVDDADLPEPGKRDVKGGILSTGELRAHRVEASWIEAGTLYVRSLETK